MPQIMVNNRHINYTDDGSGEVLFFISGLGGEAIHWTEDIKFYRENFRCIAVDSRGMGKSDPVMKLFTVKDLAGDILGIMDGLKIEKADFIGHSMGGAVIQEFAAAYPERTSRIILVSTWARNDAYTRQLFETLRDLNRKNDLDLFVRTLSLWCYTPGYFNNHPDLVAAGEQFRIHNPFRENVIEFQLNACLEHDSLSRLSSINSPTLVTSGNMDILFPTRFSGEIAGAIPDAQLEIFEDTGHLLQWEKPEEFHSRTMDFLLEN